MECDESFLTCIEHRTLDDLSSDRVRPIEDHEAFALLGGGFHGWAVEGGTIRLPEALLRPVLEAACDPAMADWPALVEIDADPLADQGQADG
jgi:hypothetical protein